MLGLSFPGIGCLLQRTRKLKLWVVLRRFFFQRLRFIFISAPNGFAGNTVAVSVMVLEITAWLFWIGYRNGYYMGLLVLWFLLLLNPWFFVEMYPGKVFYRYCFVRYPSGLFPLPYSHGRSTHFSIMLCDFSVDIRRYSRDAYVNCLFPHTTGIWKSECFPLLYDLNTLSKELIDIC